MGNEREARQRSSAPFCARRASTSYRSYTVLRPGLTGPWQVDGRNAISYGERVQLDVDYAETVGFRRDLGIVLKTDFSVLRLTGK